MPTVFNRNSPYVVFLGLVAIVALWIPAIGNDAPYANANAIMMPFESIIHRWAAELPLLYTILALVSLIIFAALLIQLERTYRISQRLYTTPFVYLLLCSAFLSQMYMNGAYIATLLFIAAIFLLFRLYKTTKVNATMFYAGMLLSGASLFYAPAIFLLLLLPISLILFRQTFVWREYVIAFFGVCTPFFYYEAISFLVYDEVFVLYNIFHKNLFTLSDLIYENSYVTEKIYLAYLMFLMLQTLFLLVRGLLTSKQSVKKIHVLLLWAFFILLGVSLFLPSGSILLMPLLSVPSSILLANYLTCARNRGFAMLQFVILVLFTFWIRYLG